MREYYDSNLYWLYRSYGLRCQAVKLNHSLVPPKEMCFSNLHPESSSKCLAALTYSEWLHVFIPSKIVLMQQRNHCLLYLLLTGWIVLKIIKDTFAFHIFSWTLFNKRRPNLQWSSPTCCRSYIDNTMRVDALATLGAWHWPLKSEYSVSSIRRVNRSATPALGLVHGYVIKSC